MDESLLETMGLSLFNASIFVQVSEIPEQQYYFSKRNKPDSPGGSRSQLSRAA